MLILGKLQGSGTNRTVKLFYGKTHLLKYLPSGMPLLFLKHSHTQVVVVGSRLLDILMSIDVLQPTTRLLHGPDIVSGDASALESASLF